MSLLEIKDIKKEFPKVGGILNGVSLEVERGEVVVILGPSGCGKSTLLRCINGLEEIQQGEILLDGEIISNRKKNMHLIRQKIGMVFQSYDLFPHLTVEKNNSVDCDCGCGNCKPVRVNYLLADFYNFDYADKNHN